MKISYTVDGNQACYQVEGSGTGMEIVKGQANAALNLIRAQYSDINKNIGASCAALYREVLSRAIADPHGEVWDAKV